MITTRKLIQIWYKLCKKGGKTHTITPNLTNFGIPSDNPLAKPGYVCTLTFTASKGQREISAIDSADVDPTACQVDQHLVFFNTLRPYNVSVVLLK